MPLDSKKFVATADGKQIRLFPENYQILDEAPSGSEWVLRIDPGVDKALAILIFGEYHTNDKLRWGRKEEALKILNALLEPEEEVDPEYTTDWDLEEVVDGYHIWVRYCRGRELYQCTIASNPPQTNAGYCDRSALLKLKGVVLAPGFEQAG